MRNSYSIYPGSERYMRGFETFTCRSLYCHYGFFYLVQDHWNPPFLPFRQVKTHSALTFGPPTTEKGKIDLSGLSLLRISSSKCVSVVKFSYIDDFLITGDFVF